MQLFSSEQFSSTLTMLRPTYGVVSKALLAILPQAIGGLLAGLILAVALIYALARWRFLVRRPRAWNVFSKLWYLVVLLAMPTLGFTLGAAKGVKLQAAALIHLELRPRAQAQLPKLRDYLTSRVSDHHLDGKPLDQVAGEILRDFYSPPRDNSWRERFRSRVTNYFTLNMGKWILATTMNSMLVYAGDKTGDALGLQKETVRFSIDVFRRMDFTRIDSNLLEILERALLDKLNALWWSTALQIALIGLAICALPLLDFGIYCYWRKKAASRN